MNEEKIWENQLLESGDPLVIWRDRVPSLRSGSQKASEQPFLALQVTERSDVGQREGKAVLVLIAHRAERKSPVFKADATTVPVVGRLRGGVLQQIKLTVKTGIARDAPSSLGRVAVAKLRPHLVKQRQFTGGLIEDVRNADREVHAGSGGIGYPYQRYAEKCLAGADEVIAEVKSGI